MRQRYVTTTAKLFCLALVLGGMGTAKASITDLGSLGTGNVSFTELVSPGGSFTDYVRFTLDNAAQVSSFIKSFNFSIFSFDLLGIDNFSASLQQLGQGGFQTVASSSGSPISFEDLLNPGQYQIALSGISSGFFGGLYRGTLHVAAVPETDTWIMLLVGIAVVLYQLRRKQRSLGLRPLTA